MKNITIETHVGDNFESVAKKAKKIAANKKKLVEFDFNSTLCVVSENTNLEYLQRDYMNSHIMEWDAIGHNCVEHYSNKVSKELSRRLSASKRRSELASKKKNGNKKTCCQSKYYWTKPFESG